MDLNDVLRHAVAAGASDVHLKVGQPPVLRSDGALAPAPGEPLGDSDLESVLAQVTAAVPERRQAFDQTGDLDLAYSADGLPRFRVNGFRQRGAISFAFRMIPNEIPNFGDLHLPPGVARLAQEQRGLVDRGSDRGPPRRPRLHRESARDRDRHRELRPGAATCAPPGPGRDSAG